MALLHGLHAQVFPRLNLPCFSDVLWRATVGRCARKSAACAELWGLIFLCRVKVHTVRVFQWPSWRALASQNLLGSGFLVHGTQVPTIGWSEASADIEKVFSSRTSFLAQRGAERSIGKPEVESHY